MTEFQEAILQIVRLVPAGKVISYGQLAAYVGTPRAARQVGWAMRSLEGVDFPWYRVLNNEGRITIKGNKFHDAKLQRQLLEAEGVIIHDYQLDMRQYRFRPDRAVLQGLQLDQLYIDTILTKYDIG
jgi:methylated-DNA-protein-cysteine methyltransferase-like protein